jgi:hypothetical protein
LREIRGLQQRDGVSVPLSTPPQRERSLRIDLKVFRLTRKNRLGLNEIGAFEAE